MIARGGAGVPLRFRACGLWLTVPLFPKPGAGWEAADWGAVSLGEADADHRKKECLAPCSGAAATLPYSTSLPLCWGCSLARVLLPWACLAAPSVRGRGPHSKPVEETGSGAERSPQGRALIAFMTCL
jgi:hypothetical protein